MQSKPRYQPGDKIGGRYFVHQALMGGMGEVYLCLDLEENLPYALKTFQERHLANMRSRCRFEEEVGVWVALEKHPNIVRCFGLETLGNQPFMLLEWIASNKGHERSDLRSWLRHGPLDLRLALDFTVDICRGLIHAQNKQPGMVHCDLKPENILIAQGPVAKITDFGLAKVVRKTEMSLTERESEASGRQNLNGRVALVGTPPYMASEQWRGEELDTRTDIYAVGCILYEMLTGRVPFEAKTLDELRYQHLESPIPTLEKTCPSALNGLLAHCLAKQKNKRFRTGGELLQELECIYREQFTTSPKPIGNIDDFTDVDFNNRGSTYYKLKRYDDALSDFHRAIELNPNLADAYYNRGVTYRHLQRYNDALAEIHRAIELNPKDAEAYNIQGLIYHDLRQYDDALSDLHRAIELNPNLGDTYINRSITYRHLQRYNDALADVHRAIELDPNLADGYVNRGNIYTNLQRYDNAIADYTHAIELDPTNALAYSNRGNTFAERQRYNDALVDVNRAIELDPNLAEAYFNRGNTYRYLQLYDDAIADYTRAIELDPNHAKAYSNRGLTYNAQRRYDEALVDYSSALGLNPNLADTYFNRGITYLHLQQWDDAWADFRRTIELNPTDAQAHLNIGILHANRGELQEALPYFERAAQLGSQQGKTYFEQTRQRLASNSKDAPEVVIVCGNGAFEIDQGEVPTRSNKGHRHLWEKIRFHYQSSKGTILGKLGRYEAAVSCFDKALKIDPRNANVWYNKGTSLHNLDRYEAAISCYEITLEIDPRHALAWYNKGVIFHNLGQYEAAIDCYDKALEVDSRYAPTWSNKGVILAKLGRYEAAIGCYDKALEIDPKDASAWYNKARSEETMSFWDKAAHSYRQFIALTPPQDQSRIQYAHQRLRELESR